MKALTIAVVVVVLSLGVVAGAVFGLGDDEVLTQPPESVAREFVRAILLGQVGAARAMLSRDADRRTSDDDLRRISAELRAGIGRLEDVDGKVTERKRDRTTVRARIEGERANAERTIGLVRESGAWSVARASDVLEIGDSAARGRRQ